VVVDRFWNLIDANQAAGFFMEGAPPELLEPPLNVLTLSLHPDGMARNILNLGEWRAHMIERVRRHVALTADASLAQLYRELRDYPGPEATTVPSGHEVVIPLRMRVGGTVLSFFSTIATFGTPVDITVAELAIESFYPADARTSDFLRERAAR
jgi:hypothetical protein